MTCERWRENLTLSLYGELAAGEAAALEAHLAGCGGCREARAGLAGTVALLRRDEAEERCARARERITLGLYGELEPAEAAELEGHLEKCSACREARAALGGTVALLRRGTAASGRRSRRWWPAAAAAVMAIAAGAALLARERSGSGASPVAVRQGSGAGAGETAVPAGVEPAPGASLAAEDRLCAAALGDDPVAAIEATARLGTAGTRRSTPALRAALARPVTRLAAFRALRARGELALEADVIPALRDAVLRREAADVLLARRTPAAFGTLLAEALRGNEACRAACRAFPAEIAAPALVAAADAADGRGAAIELLLTTDGDAVRAALVELARDDAGLRAAAFAAALADVRDSRRARFLVLALADDALAGAAREAMAGVPLKRLRAALQSALREPELRGAVVDYLAGRASDETARHLLAGVLGDDDLRLAAARALLAQGDLRAVAPLLAAAGAEEIALLETLPAGTRRRELARGLKSEKLRAGAVAAIGEADGGLWRDLLPLLGLPAHRGDAAEALARCGAGRAIPFLIPWVSTDRDGSRVRRALVSLAGTDAGDSPCDWSRWWNNRNLNP